MPVLSWENITKSFENTCVIKNISRDFDEGKFICLLGNSGSGKTTLLRLVAGLEKPDSGKIYLFGKLASEGRKILIPPSQRETGFIFQDLALWPHLTVYENIAFGLKVQKTKSLKSKILDMLDFFSIEEHKNKYPGQLSGGQQQLVAIARSLVLRPRILLMDEPLANLDIRLKSKIRDIIKKLAIDFSVTIIYVTHDHEEAFKLADEIVVIHEGKIIDGGTPEDILKSKDTVINDFIKIGGYS